MGESRRAHRFVLLARCRPSQQRFRSRECRCGIPDIERVVSFKEPRHHGAHHRPLKRSPPPFLPTRKPAGFPVAISVNASTGLPLAKGTELKHAGDEEEEPAPLHPRPVRPGGGRRGAGAAPRRREPNPAELPDGLGREPPGPEGTRFRSGGTRHRRHPRRRPACGHRRGAEHARAPRYSEGRRITPCRSRLVRDPQP